MSYTIEITGIRDLQQKLDKVTSKDVFKQMHNAGAQIVKTDLQEYPEYTSKWYVRTGTLKRRWTVKASAEKAEVGNITSYGPHVMGDSQRKIMAQIGWRKVDDIAKANEKIVANAMEDILKNLLR
jgi:hypothetical protein